MAPFKFGGLIAKQFASILSALYFALVVDSARSQVVDQLPPAFNYQLIGVQIIPGEFETPDPAVDIYLNPQPLPPRIAPGTYLDLTNPDSPVYFNPDVASVYEIDFGVNAGGAVSFNVPGPTPPDPADFSFIGNNPGGDPYVVAFQIGGGVIDPGSFVELNPQPLPPFPDPNFNFVQFQFSFEPAAEVVDPTLTFQVNSGNTDFAFEPRSVPEPASFALAGIAAFGLLSRRHGIE